MLSSRMKSLVSGLIAYCRKTLQGSKISTSTSCEQSPTSSAPQTPFFPLAKVNTSVGYPKEFYEVELEIGLLSVKAESLEETYAKQCEIDRLANEALNDHCKEEVEAFNRLHLQIMQAENERHLLLNPEPEEQPEENSEEVDEQRMRKAKARTVKLIMKLFRKIAGRTHPDKTDSTRLHGIFKLACEMRDNLDLNGLEMIWESLKSDGGKEAHRAVVEAAKTLEQQLEEKQRRRQQYLEKIQQLQLEIERMSQDPSFAVSLAYHSANEVEKAVLLENNRRLLASRLPQMQHALAQLQAANAMLKATKAQSFHANFRYYRSSSV